MSACPPRMYLRYLRIAREITSVPNQRFFLAPTFFRKNPENSQPIRSDKGENDSLSHNSDFRQAESLPPSCPSKISPADGSIRFISVPIDSFSFFRLFRLFRLMTRPTKVRNLVPTLCVGMPFSTLCVADFSSYHASYLGLRTQRRALKTAFLRRAWERDFVGFSGHEDFCRWRL